MINLQHIPNEILESKCTEQKLLNQINEALFSKPNPTRKIHQTKSTDTYLQSIQPSLLNHI